MNPSAIGPLEPQPKSPQAQARREDIKFASGRIAVVQYSMVALFTAPFGKSFRALPPLSVNVIVPVGQGIDVAGVVFGYAKLQLLPFEFVTTMLRMYPLEEPYVKFCELVVGADGTPLELKDTKFSVVLLD